MFRVYISASTQKENIGVDQYGNEQDRMQYLSDRISYWLKTQRGNFVTFRNQPGWSLKRTMEDCNNLACDVFIDNHTNAGPKEADGTEVYHHGYGIEGMKLAKCLFKHIGPLSPGGDRGVLSDTDLYVNGLYILRETNPPAALIEHIYHTNSTEVLHFLRHIDEYAKKTAMGIAEYFNVKWLEPNTESPSVDDLVDQMIQQGLVTDKNYWVDVLNGTKVPDAKFLQIVFTRALNNK